MMATAPDKAPPPPADTTCGICANAPVRARRYAGGGRWVYLCEGHGITATYGSGGVQWWDEVDERWTDQYRG